MSTHSVISNYSYSPTCFELTVDKQGLDFEPGTCAAIMGRSYSLCSAPHDPYLRFIIRKFENGEVSNKLANLRPNDTLQIDELFSYFKPVKNLKGPFCFIATGTGIAPFMSALRHFKARPEIILYGAKTQSDLYGSAYLTYNSNTICAVSRDPQAHPTIQQGRVDKLYKHLPISEDMTYYICGIEGMLTDASNYLINKGIKYNQIQQELFYSQLV
jgi:NAD(P)H-flavin reductase